MPAQKTRGAEGSIRSDIPRGAALKSYLSQVTSDVQQLESAIQSLPRVDEKGSSECPFAEDLFAQKEELEAKLSNAAPTLRAYLAALEREVSRCQGNLGKIRAGAGQVATAGVVDALDSAAKAAEDAAYQATTDRDDILLVLPRVEAALRISRTRKYPGKQPERTLFPRGAAPPGRSSDGSGSVLGRELEDVLSLGPLGS